MLREFKRVGRWLIGCCLECQHITWVAFVWCHWFNADAVDVHSICTLQITHVDRILFLVCPNFKVTTTDTKRKKNCFVPLVNCLTISIKTLLTAPKKMTLAVAWKEDGLWHTRWWVRNECKHTNTVGGENALKKCNRF